MSSENTDAWFVGSIPENYDRYLGPLLFEFSGADMARRVAAKLDGPARILELACGTGISTRHLAAVIPEASEITATDLNQAMLDHAQKVNGTLPGVSYQQADALDLPFDDSSFDAVVCQFGVMFFPDKAAGMAEMARVLKPGGFATITTWDSFEHNPSVPVVDQVIQSFFEADPPRFLEVPFGMYETGKVKALFAGAGFGEVDVAYVAEQIEVSDLANVARGSITGNPTIIEVEKRGIVGVETIIDAVTKALEEKFGPTPVSLPFREITFQSCKPAV